MMEAATTDPPAFPQLNTPAQCTTWFAPFAHAFRTSVAWISDSRLHQEAAMLGCAWTYTRVLHRASEAPLSMRCFNAAVLMQTALVALVDQMPSETDWEHGLKQERDLVERVLRAPGRVPVGTFRTARMHSMGWKLASVVDLLRQAELYRATPPVVLQPAQRKVLQRVPRILCGYLVGCVLRA